jgi:hypothetical protein
MKKLEIIYIYSNIDLFRGICYSEYIEEYNNQYEKVDRYSYYLESIFGIIKGYTNKQNINFKYDI